MPPQKILNPFTMQPFTPFLIVSLNPRQTRILSCVQSLSGLEGNLFMLLYKQHREVQQKPPLTQNQ